MFRLVLVGFLSLLAQVALLRELSVSFYGVELVYPLALAVWLLWTAVGAAVSHRAVSPSPSRASWLLVLLALLLPLDVVFLRYSRILLGGLPGAYLPLLEQLAVLSASLLPAGLLSGLLFQWAARLYLPDGRTLALAYSVESLGSVAGGLASTLLLAVGLQNFLALLTCSLCAALGAIALAQRWRVRAAAGAAVAALLAVLWGAGAMDRRMTAWNHPHLVATRDSPYGRITVTLLENQVSVFENDALFFETQGTAAEEFVHVAALQHPCPQRVLILGGGISGLVREALKHGPSRVDSVELNRVLEDLVLPFLPRDTRDAMAAASVRTFYADPRRFLGQAEPYDLIIVGMPDPSSGQSNRFYTREFFELCRARLAPGGLLAFRLSSAENLLTPPMARRLASICRAARSAFQEILVLPGATNTVLASGQPLLRDPTALARRLRERNVRARLVSAPYLEYVYTNDRLREIEGLLRTQDAAANTDVAPICFQHTVMIWLSKFVPAAVLVDVPATLRRAGALKWCLVVGLAALFVLSRIRPGFRRALLAAVAGFIGMVLETVWILHYQLKNGVLFQDIGLLLMVFMAGLAAGALFVDRLGRPDSRQRFRRSWGILLVVGFCLFSGLTALAVAHGRLSSLSEVVGDLALAGFLVAGIFAYASLHGVKDQRRVISPLYAADLLGGAFAAVVGTFLAIPALGLAVTAGWTALVAAAAALLL